VRVATEPPVKEDEMPHCLDARTFLAATLGVAAFVVSPAWADGPGESVVSRSDLASALAERASQDEASRQALLSLLGRPEVREMAEGMGLDEVRASAAVAALDGDELQVLAGLAEQVDLELAGGQGVGTMSGGTGHHFPFLYVLAIVAIVLVIVLAA
jgi:hypothetical protein